MSADGIYDWEADEARPGRDTSRAPGLDARPSRDADLGRDAEVGRAFGELASENADLYKRIDSLEAQLKMEQARHSAWSREVARRDEAMAGRMERLERRLAEKPTAIGGGTKERRLAGQETLEDEQKAGQERSRGRASNESIAVGVTVGAVVLSAVGDVIATPEAASITGIAGGLIAAAAAGLAWIRKRREEADADRSQG